MPIKIVNYCSYRFPSNTIIFILKLPSKMIAAACFFSVILLLLMSLYHHVVYEESCNSTFRIVIYTILHIHNRRWDIFKKCNNFISLECRMHCRHKTVPQYLCGDTYGTCCTWSFGLRIELENSSSGILHCTKTSCNIPRTLGLHQVY